MTENTLTDEYVLAGGDVVAGDDLALLSPGYVLVRDGQIAAVGEGPVWDARSGRLIWVDIEGAALHSTHPETGETTTQPMPMPIRRPCVAARARS